MIPEGCYPTLEKIKILTLKILFIMNTGTEDTILELKRKRLAKILAELAVINDLEFIKKDQYRSKDDVIYTQTHLGYVCTIGYNYRMNYRKLLDEHYELLASFDAIKGEKKKLVVFNKEITDKNMLKLATIIKANISDSEKISEIKRYLNL